MNPIEAEVRRRALDRTCPTCGAEPWKRCVKTIGSGYYQKSQPVSPPHPDRVSLAWRDMLKESAS